MKNNVEKTISIINKVLTTIGVILISILLFPILFKDGWLRNRIKDILNPNTITGNTEFRESHESTKQSPKIDIKVDGEWKPIELDVDQKKKPVQAVFVSKNRKTGKVDVEIKHEKVDRKSSNSDNVSKSAFDYISSRK